MLPPQRHRIVTLDLGKVKMGCCQALPGVNFASSYPWGTAAIHQPLEFSFAWEAG